MTKDDIKNFKEKAALGEKYLYDIELVNDQITELSECQVAENNKVTCFSDILGNSDYYKVGYNIVKHDKVALKEFALELLRKRKERLQKEFDEL